MSDDSADETPPPGQPTQRSLLRWSAIAAVWAATIWFAVGVLLHLTIRDRLRGASTIFYASPPAVLAIIALLAAIGWSLRRRGKVALLLLIAAIACGVWWRTVSFVERARVPASGDLHIMFWNTARGDMGWENIVANIRHVDAPLVGIVEAVPRYDTSTAHWREAFPDYDQTDAENGILLLVKGRILRFDRGSLGIGGKYLWASVEVEGKRLQVVLVDIEANPLMSRRAPVNRMLDRLEELSGDPLIVMGDFNMPSESVYFRRFREQFQGAFETAGDGYTATWPLPAPVLKLDHIWLGEGLEPISCHAGWADGSDHRHLECLARIGNEE